MSEEANGHFVVVVAKEQGWWHSLLLGNMEKLDDVDGDDSSSVNCNST